MDGGATRVSDLRTTVPFRRAVAIYRRKGWFVFLVFFICFVWLRRWWVLWCVVGCLSVVVWVFVGLRLFDLFSLLVVVEVMFARNIGGDGSVTMVMMDHI